MSSVFSRLAVITQSQHDAECLSPTESVHPAPPDHLCPNVEDEVYDDPDAVQACPDPNAKSTSINWLSCITSKKAAQSRASAKARKTKAALLAKQCKLKVGCFVKSCHKLIAPLSKAVISKHKSRVYVFGTIVARSDFNQGSGL